MYQFHAEEKIEEAKQRRGPEQIAFIAEENDALAGLGEVNRELVQELGKRCPDPVSYTHLDVYKRQVQAAWARSIGLAIST